MANVIAHTLDLVKNTLHVLSISFLKLVHESTPLGKHDPDKFCPICILYMMDEGWQLVTHRRKRCSHNHKTSDKVITPDHGLDHSACHVANHRAYLDQTYSFPRGMVKAFRTRKSRDDTYHRGVYIQDKSRRRCFRSCQKAIAAKRVRYEGYTAEAGELVRR